MSKAKIVLALLCALLTAFLCAGCGIVESAWDDLFSFDVSFGQKKSPYNWKYLKSENGRYTYSQAGKFTSQTGIDVSEVQGFIDWRAVASDGIDFAFVRVCYRGNTEGGLYVDDMQAYNIGQALAAGLDVNAYVYSQALTPDEAEDEADLAITLLRETKFSGIVAFDLEIASGGRIGAMTRNEATACAKAFCKRIEEAGYKAAIYGNMRDLRKVEDATLESYPIWYAEYGVSEPSSPLGFTYWQYSHTGGVKGVSTDVDMNLWIKPIKQK